jgi:hypothetical protein
MLIVGLIGAILTLAIVPRTINISERSFILFTKKNMESYSNRNKTLRNRIVALLGALLLSASGSCIYDLMKYIIKH